MQALEDVRSEVHVLGKEIAGLRPLVHEVHANMPRIAVALETLARVTEKLENNTEEHKRLHFRISEAEEDIRGLDARHGDLERKFFALRDEHLICTTTNRTRRTAQQTSLLTRLKEKAAEKTIEVALVAILCFMAWIVIYHFPKYPLTATIMKEAP